MYTYTFTFTYTYIHIYIYIYIYMYRPCRRRAMSGWPQEPWDEELPDEQAPCDEEPPDVWLADLIDLIHVNCSAQAGSCVCLAGVYI